MITNPARETRPQTIDASEPVIWWLSCDEIQHIEIYRMLAGGIFEKWYARLPEYIREEMRSCRGRAPRGRLWIPQHMEQSLSVADDNPRWPAYDRKGGIVIEARHWPHCGMLIGRCTDFNLEALDRRELIGT